MKNKIINLLKKKCSENHVCFYDILYSKEIYVSRVDYKEHISEETYWRNKNYEFLYGIK